MRSALVSRSSAAEFGIVAAQGASNVAAMAGRLVSALRQDQPLLDPVSILLAPLPAARNDLRRCL
ncbi:MAG: hypothetical protein DLM68_05780, partial [Hyphomicrobiales bacterium]